MELSILLHALFNTLALQVHLFTCVCVFSESQGSFEMLDDLWRVKVNQTFSEHLEKLRHLKAKKHKIKQYLK